MIQKVLTSLIWVVALVAAIPVSLKAQPPCGTFCSMCNSTDTAQASIFRGGVAVTPKGVLKVLVVFIDFSDDYQGNSVDSAKWPIGVGPNFMNDYIDMDTSVKSGKKFNLTTYFRDMSFDSLRVVGHPYYRQAPRSHASYVSDSITKNNVAYYAIKDVLQSLDSSTINYADYDNWKMRSLNGTPTNYQHSLGSDGKVDFVFICFRNYRIGFSGWQAEGYPNFGNTMVPISLEGGAEVIIPKGFDNYGSGAVICQNQVDYPNTFFTACHEFGHYLIGAVERYNGEVEGGLWTILGSRYDNVSFFMNAEERYGLGWMEYRDITNITHPDGTIDTLPDFATTGTAFRYSSYADYDEFILENHQGLQSSYITSAPDGFKSYDVVDKVGGNGLYVIENRTRRLRVLCADGRWNWLQDSQRVTHPNNPSLTIAVFKRGSVNRSIGETDRLVRQYYDRVSGSWQYRYIEAWKDDRSGEVVNNGHFRNYGDGRDRFSADDNNIFSPWSNPNSDLSDAPRVSTPFGFEVLGQVGTGVRIKFYTSNPISASPSKPQNFHAVIAGTTGTTGGQGDSVFYYPKLTWDLNLESDVNSVGSYEIWECFSSGTCTWTQIATVAGNVSTYSDSASGIWIPSPTGVPTSLNHYYKIRAIDSQSLTSNFSDDRYINFGPSSLKIVSRSSGQSMGTRLDAAPNPFHGSTNIVFSLPNESHAILTLYDALGNVVKVLADDTRPSGTYNIEVDASSLPSGVYMVSLQIDGMQQVSKIWLRK